MDNTIWTIAIIGVAAGLYVLWHRRKKNAAPTAVKSPAPKDPNAAPF